MKKIFYITTIITIAIAFSACQKVSTYLDSTTDGFYSTDRKVYFDFANPQDSVITYSFVSAKVGENSKIIQVPTKIAGMPFSTPLALNVEVDAASTAKSGIHYTPFPASFQVPPNTYAYKLPIELLKNNLDTLKNDSIKLVLNLVSSPDLKTNIIGYKKIVIYFNNFLSEPAYWRYYVACFGPYTQIKYRKFLEYYDNDPAKWTAALISTNTATQNALYANFAEVYKYFQAHPEYNQVFPAKLCTKFQ